ncbi:hypothetical protein [Paracoccus litorisediminis]|uniref:Uncharacterized protein n=1 Tax=Paracoccus litorisediminis TaxID=2006130 RepID=A0A844HXE2_9RHOB|nr:hypothetical protein [Paracoccus litorisediminis]MTH62132.1 hypothetical protein [Paracoccus litorisediminis]
MHDTPKLDKERPDDYEIRTWREKHTYHPKTGEVHIPAMALKQALPAAAKRLGMQIPGRGKSTYTKYFEGDVLCNADIPLGIGKDETDPITINANSDGVRGSGKRVKRTFPMIYDWEATAEFTIFDDTITIPVFEEVMRAAGQSVGIGRFRPENGGINGRFVPVSFSWH